MFIRWDNGHRTGPQNKNQPAPYTKPSTIVAENAGDGKVGDGGISNDLSSLG
jgi:hypothetical protein